MSKPSVPRQDDEGTAARGPSRTAVYTAMWRAVSYLLDAEPKILVDPLARPLAGFTSDAALLEALKQPLLAKILARAPWIPTPFAVRTRYTEDALAEAFAKGVLQYVILGAGLDSFAYRRPAALRHVNVFEVDHPASQLWKRQRVGELGIDIPSTLHHVPIDFQQDRLTERLAAGGLDFHVKSFISWLGVTQYLTQEAVLSTLQTMACASVAGSELVVEFIPPAAMLAGDEAELMNDLASASADVGEPWLSYFEPRTMEEHLRQLGFTHVVHFGPEEATAKYLAGRTDILRLPAYFRMIKATVE